MRAITRTTPPRATAAPLPVLPCATHECGVGGCAPAGRWWRPRCEAPRRGQRGVSRESCAWQRPARAVRQGGGYVRSRRARRPWAGCAASMEGDNPRSNCRN
jgi:hypothetical protein